MLGARNSPSGGGGGVWTSGAGKGMCGVGRHSCQYLLLPQHCHSCHHPQPPHSLLDLSPENFYHLSWETCSCSDWHVAARCPGLWTLSWLYSSHWGWHGPCQRPHHLRPCCHTGRKNSWKANRNLGSSASSQQASPGSWGGWGHMTGCKSSHACRGCRTGAG